MPDPTPTTNFGWTLPLVDGDNNAWGTELNDLFRDIDTDLEAVKVNADAAVVAQPRCQISPDANASISANVSTQISWSGPTTAFNTGSFSVSSSGIKAPADVTGLMVLVAQIALSGIGDPSSDNAAKIKLTIEKSGGSVVGECWFQLDAQNSSAQTFTLQVTAFVNNPNAADTYVVKVLTPAGVGTATLVAAQSWFSAYMVR